MLELTDLTVTFRTRAGAVPAVRGVALAVPEGRVIGLAGESGCGKTVTMLAVLGLLPTTAEVSGSVRFRGQELVGADREELYRLRGARMGMIFQDPVTSLNPVQPIGRQIAEALRIHQPEMSRRDAARQAVELLALVGIPAPARRFRDYPHQFSGGMCQRVMIAIAVANNPDLLIADEPTTALDVTIQAQILDVLRRLCDELHVGLVLISHDLGVMASLADEVFVMYAGRIVEHGTVDGVFYQSRHPYTRGLLASLPTAVGDRRRRLTPIEGAPPSLGDLPAGCVFHPRCPHAREVCRVEDPVLRPVGPVDSACHFADDLDDVEEGASPTTSAC